MNKIYRLIWNELTRTWVAVAEITRARGKRASGPTGSKAGSGAVQIAGSALILLLTSGGLALAEAPAPTQLPTGGQIVAGSGSISKSGANMTVDQSTSRMVANWQSFDIGSQASVTFHQPSASAIALNRVLSQDPSQIMGHLNANGRVMLVNPAGIVFGKGAQVNVGGLTASTLDISNQNFMAGNYAFANGGAAGSIDNQGRITTPDGGIVALIAPVVTNEGTITTPNGSTLLAAGDQVTVDFTGDGLITYQMKAGTVQGLVKNSGALKADGGLIVMTAKAADSLTQAVVNNTGLVQAQTLKSRSGHILLLSDRQSGTTEVGGTLDASAPNGGSGGSIETSGHSVKVADTAKITTQATDGTSGNWLLDPYDFTIGTNSTNGDITGSNLSTALGSGSVTIQTASGGTSCTGTTTCTASTSGSNGDINVNAAVSWSSSNTLTLDAYRDININQPISVTGKGTLALDYGQGAASTSNTATYNVNAPVNLASTASFTTQLGSNGTAVNWTIIDSLGSSNSSSGGTLQGIQGNLSGHYVLGTNIDASATSTNSTWKGNGGFTPIGTFSTNNKNGTEFVGILDGLGHTISNLYINRPGTNYVGLFGAVASTGTIRNVGLVGGSVIGHYQVGELAGSAGGTISNAYAAGNTTGTNTYGTVGGLVGVNSGTITDAYATGSVSGFNNVGGLVGVNSGTIDGAYATDSVTSNRSSNFTVGAGGLVGVNSGKITDAYATGGVTGSAKWGYLGGLVGLSSGTGATVVDAYATGSVTGNGTNDSLGGLVGLNSSNATIAAAYAAGRVTENGAAKALGGLVGSNKSAVSSSYWDKTTSGASNGIGGGTTTGATGETTAQLSSNLPSGFSSTVWGDAGRQTTPYLLANASFATVAGSVYLGTDTGTNPPAYGVIQTLTELQNINATGLSGNYVLGTNLDASATSTWNSGAGFAPIGSNYSNNFAGTFDGLGHTISGLYISSTNNYVGLFGYVGSGGVVRNVGLVNNNVTSGGQDVGALVGANVGSVSNAYATGNVTGGYSVGGLVGGNFGATISNAYATGNVSGGSNVGGLVGGNHGTITNAYATGSVSGSSSVGGWSGSAVGGLVGSNYGGLTGGNPSGIIRHAHATGNVSGDGHDIGGLVGENMAGAIADTYATGSVSGSGYDIGGLVGGTGSLNSNGVSYVGTIVDAYATGNVNGSSNVGGLMGANQGSVSNAYATGSVSGSGNDIGGLVGRNNTNATISNVYATGAVSGGFVYGLVAANFGTVSNGYWVSVRGSGGSASAAVGNFGTTNGTATISTTTNAFSASSYAGFTFSTIAGASGNAWVIVDADGTLNNASSAAGDTLPMLASEYRTAIANAHQLQLMAMAPSASYTLGADVEASATASAKAAMADGTDVWGPDGFIPVGNATTINFTGTFDGSGHTIDGLYIHRPSSSYVGLFGYAYQATVSDVGLVGGSVTGGNIVGDLMGINNSGTVSNAYATGTVTGKDTVGGLVGNNSGGGITDAYATGSVTGSNYTGGLVGVNSGHITAAYAAGSVTGNQHIGGLVGSNNGGTASNSYYDSTTDTTAATAIGGGATTTGATGENTAAMQTLATFSGWSITNSGGGSTTWRIYEGHTYPLLTAFLTPVTATFSGNPTVTYDGATQSATVTYSTPSGTTASEIMGSLSASGINVGSYTFAGLYSDQSGYDITLAGSGAALTVKQAPLTITASPQSSIYGNTPSLGTTAFAHSTLYNNDAISGVTLSNTSNVTSASVAGTTGTITPSAATGAGLSNYNITYDPGTLTVNARPITVMAASPSRYYGDANPALTYTVGSNGLVNGDTLSGALSTAASTTSGVGGYGITQGSVTDANNPNYAITYSAGTLAVNPAPLTVTADSASKTYDGTAYSGGNGVSYSGFVNGESSSVLGGALSYGGTAQGAMSAGRYTIVPGGLSDANYAIAYVGGTLTIKAQGGNTNAGELQDSTPPNLAQSGPSMGGSLHSQPLIASGGQLTLGGGEPPLTLQFSAKGGSTTLVTGAPGSGPASGGQTQTVSVPLFSKSGNMVAPSGAVMLTELGQHLTVSPSAAGAEATPTVNEAAMHFVTSDYQLTQGASTPVAVGVSNEGMLVIEVSPQMKAGMGENSIVLVGMTIAKARLGVSPAQVKGVVISLR